MPPFRRFSFATLLSFGVSVSVSAQPFSSIPVVPVSVVRRARTPATDTTSEAVFIVHGLSVFEPTDRLLEGAYVEIGPPGTDVRSHPSRTAGTRPDGRTVFSPLDRDSLDVVVLAIGYGAVRFSLGLAKQCRQTIEVYLSQHAIIDTEVGGPSPPTPRVVFTTCTPPA